MNRRTLLHLPAATPLLAANPDARKLTITGLEIFNIKVNQRGNWILVRLQTSGGVTGIGDASHGGPDKAKPQLIRTFFESIRGRSPFDVEHLRVANEPEVLKRGPVAAVSMSAIEQAMWDLQGKALNVPVYQLFGGLLNRRIRNYANINRSTTERSPEGFAKMASAAVRGGFDAIKLAPWDDMPRDWSNTAKLDEITALGTERARAVREAIGSRDLLLDAHSHFSLERGLKLAADLEPLNLFWLEEVTPPKPVDNLAAINRAAKMPTAGGESIYGVRGFLPYIAGKAVDIAMPDVKYCGGMLELKKISALAEAAGMPVSPHGPASPIGNVAAAHVCVTIPNFQILEFAFGETEWRPELVDPPEQMDKGYLTVSDRPGLGVSLNDKMAARHAASV
jgi:galactonate dehydratase